MNTTPTRAEAKASLTPQQRSSIESAIRDCDRYIAKESPRLAHLRPPEIRQRLEWYVAHRTKLIARLTA